MIKSITVTNYLGQSLKLELRFPEKSGFLIQEITGLGPPKATINSTELVTGDGVNYNSSRVGARNIVISLKFLELPTIEEVRQLSYKYFPIKKQVSLLVETDERVCTISGYIESNEPSIFTKKSGTQISIICPDPYFYSVISSTKVFAGLDPLFEFPFSNESSAEDLILFGNVKDKTEDIIGYPGDVDVGVVMTIVSTGTVRNVYIFNVHTREKMFIDTTRLETLTGHVIIEGDIIEISTVVGNKYITLLRDGIITNILNCLSRDSDWPRLTKGNNVFAYSADDGISYLQFTIANNILYEGV